jgi:hypothetical protein
LLLILSLTNLGGPSLVKKAPSHMYACGELQHDFEPSTSSVAPARSRCSASRRSLSLTRPLPSSPPAAALPLPLVPSPLLPSLRWRQRPWTKRMGRARGRLLTVYNCIKLQVDLQADKSPVVVNGPFFPRVVNYDNPP